MCYGFVAGEIPEQQQLASRAIHTAASSRGEFPSSRNGSTATMSARLVSSSSGLQSDAVVHYAWCLCDTDELCVLDYGPM